MGETDIQLQNLIITLDRKQGEPHKQRAVEPNPDWGVSQRDFPEEVLGEQEGCGVEGSVENLEAGRSEAHSGN